MKIVLTVVLLAIVFSLLNKCGEALERVDQTQQARLESAQRELERAQTPDMIPPLVTKPIDEAAITKAANIKVENHCRELGKALRGRDAEFTRAMIQRTLELELGVLKFGQQAVIRKKQIQLGMTPCMVLAAWGRPDRVNESVGSYGVHQQWVYPANYVYFEDGILTSFQSQN